MMRSNRLRDLDQMWHVMDTGQISWTDTVRPCNRSSTTEY